MSKRFLLLNALVFVVLGGSILLNFLLFIRARQYYLELNQTRLDPLGLSDFPEPHKQVIDTPLLDDRRPLRVVFFGDSRAASWTSPIVSGYEFINRGIGSQTSVQTSLRFASHVPPLKPDVVVIQVGVNDLKTIALFPEQRQAIVSNCEANIKRMVKASKALGAVVIVTTIFPVGDVPLERKPFWSEAIAQSIQTVNATITTLADEQTIVLDAFSILADRQGVVLPQYRTDELHINEQAYEVLNKELILRLNTIKSKNNQE